MISFQAVPHSDQVVDVYRDGKIIGIAWSRGGSWFAARYNMAEQGAPYPTFDAAAASLTAAKAG